MQVLEVLQKSAEYLERRGVPSARLQSELLLADVLRLPRLRLYLEFDRVLREPELSRLREGVRRRGERVPIQHILGSVGFCGHTIEVSSEVLIPRPETELLVEIALTTVKKTCGPSPRILDFGTGSGCIAIAMAAALPGCRVDALDISEEALGLAEKNGIRAGVADRISWIRCDGLGGLKAPQPYDAILANPPYVPSAEIDRLEPEVRDHDPRLALDGGPDGLRFYRTLAEVGRTYLATGGWILLECGFDQAKAITAIFREQKWVVPPSLRDYSGHDRFLVASRVGLEEPRAE